MINPELVNTIRVGELPSEPFNLTDNIPHEIGTELKRGTVQQLADLIASVIEVTGGVGFRAVSVTDGQTLPTTTQQEFILVGKGTYFNVAGGDTIVLTEELNALVSNGSFWFVGVEIPINVELAGITQEVREGFLSTTPSEDAVFKFVQNLDLSTKENTSNKQNSLAVDGTGVKFPTVDAVNAGLATKIGGSGTTNFIPKFTGSGTVGDSNVKEVSGNVGIGVGSSTPSEILNLGLEFEAPNTRKVLRFGVGGYAAPANFSMPSNGDKIIFYNGVDFDGRFGVSDLGDVWMKSLSTNTANQIFGSINFYTGQGSGVAPLNRLNISGMGNIGVGTNDPQGKFVVNSGNSLFNTNINNGQGVIQANGNITASPATLPNQVVVKSQLDLKADLASPALTGTPTAPTATAGTNTTQIATTAFVLANAQSIPQLESNATDLTVWNNGKGNNVSSTSFGDLALRLNSSGVGNTAFGYDVLSKITASSGNTAVGSLALSNITTASNVTAIGQSAGQSFNVNSPLTNASSSIFIGGNSRALGDSQSNQIVIGVGAVGAGSNTATLGDTNITKTVLRGTVEAGNGTALNHLITKAQTLYTNQTITANKTVTIAEFVNNNELILSVDTTSGNITITLPTFTALQGYKVTVKKMDSSANSVTITGVGGINIDGSATLVVSGQYSKATVGANLSQYIIL